MAYADSVDSYSGLNDALTLLQSSAILNSADAEGIRQMLKEKEKKEKERMVLAKHLRNSGEPYVITQVTVSFRGKNRIKWSTAAPWKGSSNKLRKDTYEELINELYDHYYPSEDSLENMTLESAYDCWNENRRKNEAVSSMTIVHNEADWNHFLKGEKNEKLQYERCCLLDKKVKDITASELQEFYQILVGNGKITKKAFYNIRGLVNAAFSYAYNQGINCIDASRVSCEGLHFKDPKDNSDEVYTPEERSKLLTYIEGLPQDCYTLSVRLSFTLCIRIAELRALTWDDVDYSDPSHPKIRICHQMVDQEDKEEGIHRKATDVDYMKSHSSAGKRVFPLSKYAVEVLNELRELNPDGKYICTNKSGKNSIYTNKFNEHLKKYCEGAGIRYMSSHKIRFYAVSQMYDMGMDEKDIMALAGHSNVSTTRHYNRRLKEINMSEEQLSAGFGR